MICCFDSQRVYSQSQCAETQVHWDESKLGGPQNQGDTYFCYAYVASDLISHRLGLKVNPISIAHRYHEVEDRGSSLVISQKFGGDILKAIEYSLGRRHDGVNVPPSLRPITVALPTASEQLKKYGVLSNEKFLGLLNRILDSGNPVGLSLNVGFTYQNSFRSLPHGVTIIGRTIDASNGECSYIARETLLDQCDQRIEKHKIECKNGFVKITQSEIIKFGSAITYLK